jgi:toxin-antitoxin system PIN domain toxin
MAVTLLDVNVLVALLSQDSDSHDAAQRWFLHHARKGWATCPFTQAGFVRIISNPASSRHVIRPPQAIEVLEDSLKFPVHEFWKDDLSMAEATADFGEYLTGHQQTNDAYLLGLASRHKGRIVTFDRGIPALASAAGLSHLVISITK